MPEPAYANLARTGELRRRAEEARERLRECRICPRNCGVNRLEEEKGFCETGSHAMVSSVNPHFGEEDPLVGRHGSGTIFMTSCNLRCIFCQNFDISHSMDGRAVEPGELAAMMLRLQRMGCHNINFVTPSHVVPQILEGLDLAAEAGLSVPLVYNTGGYDAIETLLLLDGLVEIYMPDLKTVDREVAKTYLNAEDYPEVVQAAIREMYRQVGDLLLDDEGVAVRGLLIRHLVMPGELAATARAMRFLVEEVSRDTYVNVMAQYRPCGLAGNFPAIDRPLSSSEYQAALDAASRAGIHRFDERRGPGGIYRLFRDF